MIHVAVRLQRRAYLRQLRVKSAGPTRLALSATTRTPCARSKESWERPNTAAPGSAVTMATQTTTGASADQSTRCARREATSPGAPGRPRERSAGATTSVVTMDITTSGAIKTAAAGITVVLRSVQTTAGRNTTGAPSAPSRWSRGASERTSARTAKTDKIVAVTLLAAFTTGSHMPGATSNRAGGGTVVRRPAVPKGTRMTGAPPEITGTIARYTSFPRRDTRTNRKIAGMITSAVTMMVRTTRGATRRQVVGTIAARRSVA